MSSDFNKPESKWLDSIDAVEDFDAVDRVVVVLVVNQDPLLDDDFFGGIADVDHAEESVRKVDFFERRERALGAFAALAGQRNDGHADSK